MSTTNNAFISPEELDKIYSEGKVKDLTKETEEKTQYKIETPSISDYVKIEPPKVELEDYLFYVKSINLNELELEVPLSSRGRFTGVDLVRITDLKVEDLDQFLTIQKNPYAIFSLILSILEKRITYPQNLQPGYLLVQDVVEILFNLRYNFVGSTLKLEVECDKCSKINGKPYSFHINLDLSKVPILDITQCENDLREHYALLLQSMDDSSFESFFNEKKSSEAIQKIKENFKLKSPYTLVLNGVPYSFRLNYFADIAYAFHYAGQQYSPLLKKLNHQLSVEEDPNKIAKINSEIEDVNMEILSTAQKIIKAMTLVSIGDKTFNNLDSKIKAYSNLSLSVIKANSTFIDKLKFSINGDVITKCPSCSTEIRRDLHSSLNFFTLLPIEDSSSIGLLSETKKPVESFFIF